MRSTLILDQSKLTTSSEIIGRATYYSVKTDNELRQLAFDMELSKSQVIEILLVEALDCAKPNEAPELRKNNHADDFSGDLMRIVYLPISVDSRLRIYAAEHDLDARKNTLLSSLIEQQLDKLLADLPCKNELATQESRGTSRTAAEPPL